MKQTADEKTPIKYVLYTHYPKEEKPDFERWAAGQQPSGLEGVKFLLSHIASLRKLLTSPGHEGVLVLFYAFGLAKCFDGIGLNKSKDQLLQDHAELRFVEAVSDYITEQFRRDQQLLRRVRFVTSLDLYDIFGRVRALEAEHLRWWFIGETSDIHYDTPKIAEAIVRLRLLGNGIPVFRLDWDVLFSGKDGAVADLELFKAIATCLRAYRLRLTDPTVATFLFSASYETSRLRDAPASATFDDWRSAFATRIMPALRIIPELLEKVGKKEIAWEEYAEKAFDERLARKFYGLLPNELKCDGVNGLASIGAHSLASVISGAFLCLSDGAILDLPPFSNFSLNVSWIDDHLKYCLHRELRHFTSLDLELAEPALSDAKLDDVMVAKARGKIGNLPGYVLGEYLPTLLWGTVLDAWINPDPLLKCRAKDLTKAERSQWLRLSRRGLSSAVLPSHLLIALETGGFPTAERLRMKERLVREALERITDVRKMWSQLTDSGHETFASIWAKGIVDQYFPDLPERAWGIAPDTPLATPLQDPTRLNAFLLRDFDRVVEDTLMYINWTLNWPLVVRTVRSIEQGTVRTDMSWPG